MAVFRALLVYVLCAVIVGPGEMLALKEPHVQETIANLAPQNDGDSLPVRAIARLGTLRFRHVSVVTRVAQSPDGCIIASVGQLDGVIYIWNRATGVAIQRIVGKWSAVSGLAFSPNSKTLAIIGETLTLWDLAANKPLFERTHPDGKSYVALAYSPDGKSVACSSQGGTIHVYCSVTGELALILRGHSANVLGLAFGTQSSVLASAGRDGTVRIWNMKDGKEIARIEKGNVVLSSVVFTKEGTSLAVGDWDGRLSLWNWGQQRQIWQTTIGNDRIESLAISPDGSFLLSGGPSVVGMWETTTGKKRQGGVHSSLISGLADFAPDGNSIITWGAGHPLDGSWDQTIHFWNASNCQEENSNVGHCGPVMCVAVANDSKAIATGGWDGVFVWDSTSGKRIAHFITKDPVRNLTFSPDGKSLLSYEHSRIVGHSTIRLWDIATSKTKRQFNSAVDSADSVVSLVFLPEGTRFIVAGHFILETLEVSTGKTINTIGKPFDGEVYTLRRGPPPPLNLALSPNARLAAWACRGFDGLLMRRLVKLVDLVCLKELTILSDPYQLGAPLAFSADNRMFVSTQANAEGEQGFSVLEVVTTKERLQIPLGRDKCNGVCFSPDCTRIAGAVADNLIRTWDSWSGITIDSFKGHKARINQLAYAPNGKFLVSVSDDTTGLLWSNGSDREGGLMKPVRK